MHRLYCILLSHTDFRSCSFTRIVLTTAHSSTLRRHALHRHHSCDGLPAHKYRACPPITHSLTHIRSAPRCPATLVGHSPISCAVPACLLANDNKTPRIFPLLGSSLARSSLQSPSAHASQAPTDDLQRSWGPYRSARCFTHDLATETYPNIVRHSSHHRLDQEPSTRHQVTASDPVPRFLDLSELDPVHHSACSRAGCAVPAR